MAACCGVLTTAFRPADLNGRKVAMRSYSQTTPTWVRGFLMDDFGVQVDKVKWLVKEEGHVAECKDPPWVSRMEGSKDLVQALVDGDVDAILFSAKPDGDDRVVTVLDDPRAAAQEWGSRNNAAPINHMVAIRKELADSRPDIVRSALQGTHRESTCCRRRTEARSPCTWNRTVSLTCSPRWRSAFAMRSHKG